MSGFPPEEGFTS